MENSPGHTYKEAVLEIYKFVSYVDLMQENEEAGNIKMKTGVTRTQKNLELIGISIGDIERLKIIHVTGTKGKGTTCYCCESILRNCGYKTGLYISPHAFEVRERIQINGKPINEERFASCFWSIIDLIRQGIKCQEQIPTQQELYFLMCMKIFLEEKIDVAVVETGMGAEYDYTNLIRNPVVCGVVTVALDHTKVLGETLQKIAWHKGGIYKQGSVALTVPQCRDVLEVLRLRAADVGAQLNVAPSLDVFSHEGHTIDLPIPGSAARTNAGLALQLCNAFLQSDGNGQASLVHYNNQTLLTGKAKMLERFPLKQNVLKGLMAISRPGLSQTFHKPGITFYLDSARTFGSMIECCKWFESETNNERKLISGKPMRVLFFYTSKDAAGMLRVLIQQKFGIVIFCPIPDHPYPGPRTEDERKLEKSVMDFLCNTWSVFATEGPNSAAKIGSLVELIRNKNKMFCEEFYRFALKHQIQPVNIPMENEDNTEYNRDIAKSDWTPLNADIRKFENMEAGMLWLKKMVEENRKRAPSKAYHFQVLVTGSILPVRSVYSFLNKNIW